MKETAAPSRRAVFAIGLAACLVAAWSLLYTVFLWRACASLLTALPHLKFDLQAHRLAAAGEVAAVLHRLQILGVLESALATAAAVGVFRTRSWGWGAASGVFCAYACYYALLLVDGYSPLAFMPNVLGAGREPLWPLLGIVFFGGSAALTMIHSAWRFFPGSGRRHALVFGSALLLQCAVVALRVHHLGAIGSWGSALQLARSGIGVG